MKTKRKTKQLKQFLLSAILILSVSVQVYGQNKTSGKPNIIFILTDDLSYYATGFNGNKEIKTPNLDRLADMGIVFDNYYNTTAICMASRAQIMTGMYEYKTGCNFMHGSLGKNKFEKSYPMLLKKAGYEVSFAGKFGFPVTPQPVSSSNENSYDKLPVNDFDVWRGGVGQTFYETAKNKYMKDYAVKYPHSSRAYGAWAVDYLKSKKNSKKPFCMSISFKAPHMPLTPDPMFDDVYKNAKFSYPENYGPENAQHLAEQARNGRQYLTLYYKFGFYPEKYQNTLSKYYQLIYGMDYAVGMILDALKETGLDKNTIIIFTSDNGSFLGSHGMAGKVLPYEEGAKAPFIIYDPNNKNMGKKLRSDALISNVDVAPTILSFAGCRIPSNMDGKSILPVINNPTAEIREFLPLMNMWGTAPTHALAIVTKDYKYIYWPYEGYGMKATEELFSLKEDPYELKEIIGEKDKEVILKKMRTFYDEQVETIKKEGVDYNRYGWYKVFYDRHIPWSEKEPLIMKPAINDYQRELKRSKEIRSKIFND
ncbi:MAG: sulfatase [Chlorobi bacterium]|nr:sulfatase [Chlorobiota bacterium]